LKLSDKDLGMHRGISRRDVIRGIGVMSAGMALPGSLFGCDKPAPEIDTDYPPALTGMRGNHDGAFDVAHALGREGRTDWGPVQKPNESVYDLVVVGGGISGLSAAHFYRKGNPDARILIIDNHDDFGGHAKRNEFRVGNRTLIGYGGSSFLWEPSGYSKIVKELLHDLGVDPSRFETAFDQGFYRRHGLRGGLHFSKENWGVDRTVPFAGKFLEYLPLAETSLTTKESVAQMPISDAAKKEFLRLLTVEKDQIPDTVGDAQRYLSSISYRDFLSKHLGITEPEIFAVLQDLAIDPGMGIETVDAYLAVSYLGLPGWKAAGLPNDTEEYEALVHHFPDGNASIARLLVRKLVPDVAPGNTMEDVVTDRFDYSKLDVDGSLARVRLNSTVTRVKHDGSLRTTERVRVSYVRGGQAYEIQARRCVLACDNAIIPYLCPELPKPQQEALDHQLRQPILMTSVALRNWEAWKRMGIGGVLSPGSYHIGAQLDYPVSLGDYSYSGGPDEPVIVSMYRYPHSNNQGLSPREQYRRARHELLSTSFETIERNVRAQLASMLGEAGFDPATDIMAITVNRWAHGYSYDASSHALFDKLYEDDKDERWPHIRARKPFGRIAIANADSAASAMLEAAVEQAHRAVSELPRS
jgi:spermidine dehydrogenase